MIDLLKDFEIILITYNRQSQLENTLNQIFAEQSPVRGVKITVIDNRSTDGTQTVVEKFAGKHRNIVYQKNNHNIGGCGNIAKAFESATKEYFWILADDDYYDWSNWPEVEQAMANNEKLICVARYVIPNTEDKAQVERLLVQLTFFPAGIYHRSVIDDAVMRNVYDNIYTLFPHVPVACKMFNEKSPIYVVDRAIVSNGMDPERTDMSYTRGYVPTQLYRRLATASWIVGFANAISILQDKRIIHRALKFSIGMIYGSFGKFCRSMFFSYYHQKDWMHLVDIFVQLDLGRKIVLILNFAFVQSFSLMKHKVKVWFLKIIRADRSKS